MLSYPKKVRGRINMSSRMGEHRYLRFFKSILFISVCRRKYRWLGTGINRHTAFYDMCQIYYFHLRFSSL